MPDWMLISDCFMLVVGVLGTMKRNAELGVPNFEFIVMPSRVAPLVMRRSQLTIPELMYS